MPSGDANRVKIEIAAHQSHDTDAISLERYHQLKAQRRRRVAKRMLKRCPLFAVEMMLPEFPDYTQAQFEEDISRKTRKGKSIRHVKTWRFHWKIIRELAPSLWQAARKRSPTLIVVRMKLKDLYVRVTIHAKYNDEYGCQTKLDTMTLIRLWDGPVKNLLLHPAVTVQAENHEFL